MNQGMARILQESPSIQYSASRHHSTHDHPHNAPIVKGSDHASVFGGQDRIFGSPSATSSHHPILPPVGHERSQRPHSPMMSQTTDDRYIYALFCCSVTNESRLVEVGRSVSSKLETLNANLGQKLDAVSSRQSTELQGLMTEVTKVAGAQQDTEKHIRDVADKLAGEVTKSVLAQQALITKLDNAVEK